MIKPTLIFLCTVLGAMNNKEEEYNSAEDFNFKPDKEEEDEEESPITSHTPKRMTTFDAEINDITRVNVTPSRSVIPTRPTPTSRKTTMR